MVVVGVGGGGAAVGATPAPGRRPRRRFFLRRHPVRLLRVPRARTAPFAAPIARFLQGQRCLAASAISLRAFATVAIRRWMAFPSPLRRGFLGKAAFLPCYC